MAAAEHNFTIEQGTTVVKPFIWKDSAGAPVNLTGYTARMQVRPSVSAAEVYLNATTENGKLAIVPAEGRITLSLSAIDTAAFAWGKGKYDLEMVSADGTVTRLLHGAISISKEVTRD